MHGGRVSARTLPQAMSPLFTFVHHGRLRVVASRPSRWHWWSGRMRSTIVSAPRRPTSSCTAFTMARPKGELCLLLMQQAATSPIMKPPITVVQGTAGEEPVIQHHELVP